MITFLGVKFHKEVIYANYGKGVTGRKKVGEIPQNPKEVWLHFSKPNFNMYINFRLNTDINQKIFRTELQAQYIPCPFSLQILA